MEIGLPNNIGIGIYNTFPSIAAFVSINMGLAVTENLGAKALWWLVVGIAAVCFFLVLACIPSSKEESATASEANPSIAVAAKNPQMWVLALAQLCIAFLAFGYVYTYPQMFIGVYNVDLTSANFYGSLNGLFAVPACIIGGILVSKTRKPYLISLISCFGAIVVTALNMSLVGSAAVYIAHTLAAAFLIVGFSLNANLCIGPTLAKSPVYVGYTMAFINFFYYIGIFASTPLIMSLANGPGWGSATILMVAVSVAAALLTFVMMFMQKKSAKSLTVKNAA